ncbi:fibrinogen-like protein 1 [Drosophila persimilis]|uniref:fibrinogen-like protein 1 n=1 Tax=Drosophila persimilis TaxID=7234 RepID=UPI000F0877BB|nr:fibrinogen-like protein 1 [Drosophila persimilis]
MQIRVYWILVLFFLQVEADITLSPENSVENSAHCEMTRDEDDERCGAICYPIVKPLLRYAALCQGKDATINDLKDNIREKDVYIAQLKSKIELTNSMEIQLKDKETILHLKANEIVKMEKDIGDREAEIHEKKDQISKMELQIQSRETLMQSKDKLIRELENQVNSLKRTQGKLVDISEASSCLPFTDATDILTIELPGTGPFLVPCNSSVSGSGWTVIQRRVNGNENFNRTWNDYKLGFGDLRENFFLGLEKIHLMTLSQSHELYVQLGNVNGGTRYARYDDFKIGSEEEGYKLKSLGKYSGTAGDSLTEDNLNMKFSTWDHNNGTICPKYYGSGWWFGHCGKSNLNGKYYENGQRESVGGIRWDSWQYDIYRISLTFSQLMIRPKT